MAKLIITIDGPAGSGKSTIARLVAEKLKGEFLDTGAMYRAVTLAAMRDGVDLSDEGKLLEVMENNRFEFKAKNGSMEVFVNADDVTEDIRQPQITVNVKYIASAAGIRKQLVRMQRDFAANHKTIVTEGRDQGTVAFIDANVKIFLTADIEERARRREAELSTKGDSQSLEQIQEAIKKRDQSDESRSVGPLKPADDAIVLDTTNLTIEGVVEKVLNCIKTPDVKKKKMLWFRFARWLCKVYCRIFLRVNCYSIENVPKTGAVLLVSNHQSLLDPILCGIYLKRPVYFLARDTLIKHKLFGRLIGSLNTIPVKRGHGDIGAVRAVIEKLRQGCAVCLFPEATRSSDGKISTFKPGFGLLCKRGKAAIVPVVIDGAFECWPRHKKLPKAGSKIVISHGKCINYEQLKDIDERKLAEMLTDTLRRMQNDCRTKHRRKPIKY